MIPAGVGAHAALLDTVEVTELELSEVSGSLSEAETMAVFVKLPARVGRTTTDTVALAPEASVPIAHVTVVVPLQLPSEGVAETKIIEVGSVSATLTVVAADGPALLTVNV